MSAQVTKRALVDFANTVMKARNVFAAARGLTAWVAFYEAKQAAYGNLVAALPQVAAINDFWRYPQNMPVAEWLPIIEAEAERIARSKSLCRDCAGVEVVWPARRCAECQQARRRESYQKAKARARVRQRMRKCGVCNSQPLKPRQRVCAECQANARRERNRRYRKSLKERNLRRVQSDFTTEKNSTLSLSRLATRPTRNAECEAVLTVAP